ncbi:acyltransferase [Ligilactobacillus agilis]|uniref:acyltransferase n=1 Tax=Ligilactobacillus agilis TaxID=1601 RepID=UPI003F89BBE4
MIKDTLKKLIFREKSDSNAYIHFLRKKGVKIGEGCTIFYPRGTNIDYQNPQMLTIGNYVRIADGVRILTHDYSLSVLAHVKGDIVGSVKPVTIQDNVFIGMNAIILAGVTVGRNVIIGAGSIVTKDCEDNSVYAGNPARKICTLEELYNKRKKKEIEDAKRVAIQYYDRVGLLPDEAVLREYLMLFSDRKMKIPNELDKLMLDTGEYKKTKKFFYNVTPQFENLDDFLRSCNINIETENR